MMRVSIGCFLIANFLLMGSCDKRLPCHGYDECIFLKTKDKNLTITQFWGMKKITGTTISNGKSKDNWGIDIIDSNIDNYRVDAVSIEINGASVNVPQKAYDDLYNVSCISNQLYEDHKRNSFLRINVSGGDAGTAYHAFLYVSKKENDKYYISSREVHLDEFWNDVVKETRFAEDEK